MTPYVLVSRSIEFESRLRALLQANVDIVTGEFLTFGADTVIERFDRTPRIALLGPLLNYEETHELVVALTDTNPDVGVIVVREQRSDLEEWVDEISPHAVLSPNASDETIVELLDRLAMWLIENGKAEAHDFDIRRRLGTLTPLSPRRPRARESLLVEPDAMAIKKRRIRPAHAAEGGRGLGIPPACRGRADRGDRGGRPQGGPRQDDLGDQPGDRSCRGRAELRRADRRRPPVR